MNEMQVFNYGEQEVRTILIDDNPWWVLVDVCRVLDLKQPHRVASRLDEDERTLSTVIDRMGRSQKTTVINESGLYSVILRSDKVEAKAFKRWITHEVLPTIRKTGSYLAPAEPQFSVETGLQRAGLILRAAEHKAVPQNEQLRLLNIAIRDLTGTELNLIPAQNTQVQGLMDLPETIGTIKKGKSKKYGKNSVQFYTLSEIADMAGVSPVEFNSFADAYDIKGGYNGIWERVRTPQGEAREFLYLSDVIRQYREEVH